MPQDWFAQNAPQQASTPAPAPPPKQDWFSQNAPAAPKAPPAPPPITDNRKGEGVYQMQGPHGTQGIPYSNLMRAQATGYTLAGNDAARYKRDYAADPNPAPTISAYTPSTFERLRNSVANGAIGYSLEQAMPSVADALHLHPTETVNSPTYQSDKQQILAPQYLLPSPKTGVGHVVRGALTGAGQLTSGKNLAIGAGIAATGGLLAPLAAGAGTGAVIASTAGKAAQLGFAGMGAKTAFDDGRHAYNLFNEGHTDDALEAAGAALPNLALTLPALAHPITKVGEFAQGKGVDLMDSYLKAGKNAYRNGAEPGLSVLQQGPGTSVGLTREGFANGVDAARERVGGTIPNIIDNSTAQIPRVSLRSGQDSIFQNKTNVLNGPGGDTGNIPALQDLRNTMAPLVDQPGNASPREVYNAKRNMDENINWGRDLDPKDATVNNMRREMRSDVSGHLYDAVPELREPSQQYSGLAAASKLATNRTFDTNGSVFNPFRIASMIGADALTQGTTHNAGVAAGVGLATGILPEIAKAPIVKTGAATGLYQLGRGIAAGGRQLTRLFPSPIAAGAEDGAQYGEGTQPSEHEGQRFSQSTPPSGGYSLRNLTPEIINPVNASRSRFGVGPDGRAGVMIRPLGGLPAPIPPTPEATPYTFGGSLRPGVAIPQRTPASLFRSIGTSADTLPSSILRPIASPGTPAEQAAMFRRAQLGSMGDVLPSRIFAPAPQAPRASSPVGEILPPIAKVRRKPGQ